MKKSLPHDAYNELADSYAKMINIKPHNAYYEQPATKSLLYDLTDKNVLDAGCGTGVYTEWLLNKEANVVGIDANEKMIKHAINSKGDKVKFIKVNLEESLSFFQNEQFDGTTYHELIKFPVFICIRAFKNS